MKKQIKTVARYRHYDMMIVGLGQTGLSVARYCMREGLRFAVMDTRAEPLFMKQLQSEQADCEIFTGGLDTDLLSLAEEVVVSPGLSLAEPELQQIVGQGISLINDVEIFCRNISAPVLAVTGSNGKSTVVSLLTDMIKNAGIRVGLGGNIGVPVLDLLQQAEPQVYVLELSSFQLESVQSMNAQAAVILNISEDHMDRYPDIAAYAVAKSRIFQGTGRMVINRDDPLLACYENDQRDQVSFGIGHPPANHYGLVEKDDTSYLMYGDTVLFTSDQIKLQGKHNYLNCLAAIALAETLSLPTSAIEQALSEFSGLAHRCQWVCYIKGVAWYNDSKGTNVGASCAAIEGLAIDKNIILILGGVGKGADFSLMNEVIKQHVKSVIVFGEDAAKILNDLDADIRLHRAVNLQASVELAHALSQHNDRVLFSPACASFDMFDNYQHRGDVFMKLVHDLECKSS